MQFLMQEPGKCNLKIHILDVRHRHRSSNVDTVRELADRIAKGLDAPFNKKTLPSMILYDEVGLLLYDKFSAETPEYYPFGAEMEILKMRADEIVQVMHVRSNSAIVPGEVVVELGAGWNYRIISPWRRRTVSSPLRPGDTLLLGLSHDNKREELELTYDNPKGHNKVFVLNGLDVAGKTLGSPGLFDRDNWDFFRHYDEDKRCIEGFYKCLRSYEISLPGYNRSVQFLQGEFVQVTVSTKYSESDISALLADAQLKPIQHWVDSTNRHSLWLLERPLITTAQSPFA
ncbi:histidine-specific methyltransferase [Scleroderma citrinum]